MERGQLGLFPLKIAFKELETVLREIELTLNNRLYPYLRN